MDTTEKTEYTKLRRAETVRGRRYCEHYRTSYCARLCDSYGKCPVPGTFWPVTLDEHRAALAGGAQ